MPGKKGNRNALKHGFYAQRFTDAESRNLDQARQDLLDEIAMLRIFADRIAGRLSEKEPANYSEDDLKCLNTLVNITTSIGTLMRSQALMTGKHSTVEKAIEDAVLSMKERWVLA